MQELASHFRDDINYAESVVEAFRDGLSHIMQANCYQLIPVEYQGFNFSIPSDVNHRIMIKCNYELQLTSIDIWALGKNLQIGHTLRLILTNDGQRPVIQIDELKLIDYRWFNPRPVIRHCQQLIDDLDLPIAKLGIIRQN